MGVGVGVGESSRGAKAVRSQLLICSQTAAIQVFLQVRQPGSSLEWVGGGVGGAKARLPRTEPRSKAQATAERDPHFLAQEAEAGSYLPPVWMTRTPSLNHKYHSSCLGLAGYLLSWQGTVCLGPWCAPGPRPLPPSQHPLVGTFILQLRKFKIKGRLC